MALPTDDLGWVHYLSLRHDSERAELENLNRYYESSQGLTYMHPEIFREVADRIKPVIIAWPQLVVDTIEERLDVEGFRLPDEQDEDKDFWRIWQSNDLDEQSQLAHVDALTMRRAYMTVGTNEDDPSTPLVTAESPLEMYADIDPRTRTVRAALRRVVEYDALLNATKGSQQATLYLPNRTVWYELTDGGWQEQRRDEHKLGVVPVVPITNRDRLSHAPRTNGTTTRLRYGTSELAPILPLSESANKIATDMMLGAEFTAIPLRGFWGLGPDDMVDEDGNKLTALQAVMGKFLTFAEPEGREFQFPAADLKNFHQSINALAQLVAAIAGLPPHYLGFTTENPASADAIRSAESRLVKRAERKQRAFGGSYEQVMRLVRRFQTGSFDPRLRQLETVWRDASTPTVAQTADATVKKFQAQIISKRQAREDLHYTDAQIKRMEQDDEREALADPTLTAVREAVSGPSMNGQREPTGAGS